MIWKRARLLRERTVSDELNDSIGSGEFETLRKVEARIAPWSIEEQQIYGATVTESEVKVLLKMPRKMYPKTATHIRIEADTSDALAVNQPMEILSVAQRGTRFVTIRCRGVENVRLEIKIEGDAKVRGAFKKLQDLGGIKDLCVRQAQQMEERGKAAMGTPGATPRKTGDLRKSLMTDTQMPDGAAVGYTMEYAPHVEYGHRTRGGGGYVEGQHFLKTNMETQAPIFEQETKEYLQRFIDAATQGG